MTFVKLVKNKAYFKRYQVKYRRRREGKTDYYARKRLVVQAKNKYMTRKYRMVVRITNTDVICQIVYSRVQGDLVLVSAYAHELPNYGVKVGLTNYAAAYCTGLLCARRALSKIGLSDKFIGKEQANGEYYIPEELENGRRPFKAVLDVGLARTSTGARIFAAMKGAADGGVNVPHSERRLPGFDSESQKMDSEVLRKYIFGGHVADYMRALKEEDEERYKVQFSRFIKAGIQADMLESMYAKAHELIRKDPSPKPNKKDHEAQKKNGLKFKKARLTYDERRARIEKKKAEFKSNLGMDEDDE